MLTQILMAAGAIAVCFGLARIIVAAGRLVIIRWPRRPPSPTLDGPKIEAYAQSIYAEFQNMITAIDRLGSSIAATSNPAGMTPVVILLEKILGEVTTSVAAMEIDQERDGHIRAMAEALTTPRGDQPAVIAKLDELQRSLAKQHHAQIQALDALVLSFDKFHKQQVSFQNALFNGGSISTMDDASAAQEEKIQALQSRYGLSRDAAKERVMGSQVYEPNTGRGTMGGQA